MMLMKFFSSLFIASAILICGCVHTKHINQVSSAAEMAEMNRKLNGRKATIQLKNEQQYVGLNVQVNHDSTTWVTAGAPAVRVPTAEIERIVILNRGRGALQGFCFTSIIFAPLGGWFLGEFAAWVSESGDDFDEGWALVGAAVGGVGTGIVLGMPIGAAIGSKDKYVIAIPEDSSATPPKPVADTISMSKNVKREVHSQRMD